MQNFMIYFLVGGATVARLACKEMPNIILQGGKMLPGLVRAGTPLDLIRAFGTELAAHLVEVALYNANEGKTEGYEESGEYVLDEEARQAFQTDHADCTITWLLKEHPYTVSALKTWNTHDGGGYQGNLIRDGKRVGTFHDDGHGGSVLLEFLEKKGGQIVRNKDEEEAFYAYIKTLPRVGTDMVDPHDDTKLFIYEMNSDTFIAELVEDSESIKWFKRHCAKETVFQLKGDPPEKWRTLKMPYNKKAQRYLDEKYGDKVIEIANLTRL